MWCVLKSHRLLTGVNPILVRVAGRLSLLHTAVQIGAITVQFRCKYPDTVW